MSETKTVTLRLPIEQVEYLTQIDDCSINQAVINVVNENKRIKLLSLQELKGKFTSQEWIAFADSLNGTLIDEYTRYSLDMFIAHCEDSEMLEGTFSRYEIKIKELEEKLKTITVAQLVALYDRIEQFWECNATSNINIEEWANF